MTDSRFFALAWIHKSTTVVQPDSTNLFDHYTQILDQLARGLPEQFGSKLNEVRQGLPLLFRPNYPMVLNHNDILEMNIHVDEETGHITGIADWADALVTPFGTSLGGLETILDVQI